MGAQSDFISEQFVPSERHKAQQRAIAEMLSAAGAAPVEVDNLSTSKENSRMARKRIQPHLIEYQGALRCSICKIPFPPDTQPSVDEAFAEHVVKVHRPGQMVKDFRQPQA